MKLPSFVVPRRKRETELKSLQLFFDFRIKLYCARAGGEFECEWGARADSLAEAEGKSLYLCLKFHEKHHGNLGKCEVRSIRPIDSQQGLGGETSNDRESYKQNLLRVDALAILFEHSLLAYDDGRQECLSCIGLHGQPLSWPCRYARLAQAALDGIVGE